jgi:hypothetical protein
MFTGTRFVSQFNMNQQQFEHMMKDEDLLIKPICIIMKTGENHFGFYERFDDHAELKESFRFRFIPNTNFADYYNTRHKEKKNFSIIIDAGDVISIKSLS